MRVVKPNKAGISEAVKVLKSGGVIVYPTDTAYGLGGLYHDKKVINRIFKIKKRSDPKFTLIASSLNQTRKFFKLSSREIKIAEKYWPGALSLVVSQKYSVRVPQNEVSRTLARRAGSPLIATSANFTGQATIYSSKKIIKQFEDKKNQPDLIVDAGNLLKVLPSTIIKVGQKDIELVRQGSVKMLDW